MKLKRGKDFSQKIRRELIDQYMAEEVFEQKFKNLNKQVEADSIKTKAKRKKNLPRLAVLMFIIVLFLLTIPISYFTFNHNSIETIASAEIVGDYSSSYPLTAYSNIPKFSKKFVLDDELSAEKAYIFIPEMGKKVFQQKSGRKSSVASLTKLMVAYTIFTQGDMGEEVCVSSDAQLYGSIDLEKEDCFKKDDLTQHLLTHSSNDAAVQFKNYFSTNELDLIDEMNKNAKKLNLQNTEFSNSVGLDDINNYSTAEDVGSLLHAVSINEDLNSMMSVKTDTLSALNNENTYEYETTNQLLLEREEIIIGKTGFTSEAGGCLAIKLKKEDWDYSVIFVILGSDDTETRFSDMNYLIDTFLETYGL